MLGLNLCKKNSVISFFPKNLNESHHKNVPKLKITMGNIILTPRGQPILDVFRKASKGNARFKIFPEKSSERTFQKDMTTGLFNCITKWAFPEYIYMSKFQIITSK